MTRNLILSFLTVITLLIAGCSWWTANAPTIETGLKPVEACLVDELADNGLSVITDPMLLITGCVGATLEALYSVVSTLIKAALPSSTPAEAGVAAVAAMPSPYVMRLFKVQMATHQLLKQKASIKQ